MPKILMRRDTAATWAAVNPTLSSGEWALETDTGKMKLGDGQTAWNSLDYYTEEDKEWEKPADWPDIRSGALPNSAYYLVAHAAPAESGGVYSISSYPYFTVKATLSTAANSYDVYVDSVKVATTTSGTATVIDWAALYNNATISGGFEISYPSNLVAHIVRVTPAVSTDTIDGLTCNGTYTNPSKGTGVLWCHLTFSNWFNAAAFLSADTSYHSYLLEAVTSATGSITVSDLTSAFIDCSALKEIPTISSKDSTLNVWGSFRSCSGLKKVSFNNVVSKDDTAYSNNGLFRSCENLEQITGLTANLSTDTFSGCKKLKKLPNMKLVANANGSNAATNMISLQDTYIDLSAHTNKKSLGLHGSSTDRMDGLKGLVVSSSAPFDNATSPQLNVSYTGLDRGALVNLFQSMPYNVAYEQVGNPTIVDGIVSGFSSSNYLTLPNTINFNNDFEVCFEFKFTTELTESYYTLLSMKMGSTYSLQIIRWASNQAYLRANSPFNVGTGSLQVQEVSDWQLNKIYKVIWKRVGSTGYLDLYKEGTLIASATKEYTTSANSLTVNWIGANASSGTSPFSVGEINLNNSYIKSQGQPWFGPGATKNLVPGGTLVGSPTITNGVASGFSNSKYISVPQASIDLQNISAHVVFTATTVDGSEQIIYQMGNSGAALPIGFRIHTNNKIVCYHSGSSESQRYSFADFTLEQGKTYEVEFGTVNSVRYFKAGLLGSMYDQVINQGSDSDFEGSVSKPQYLGWASNASSSQYYKGSIDLNNTFIKVGSNYTYRGMVPQVKTCSVVGCTGTSSLTAADKAIATDKGWSLTVS